MQRQQQRHATPPRGGPVALATTLLFLAVAATTRAFVAPTPRPLLPRPLPSSPSPFIVPMRPGSPVTLPGSSASGKQNSASGLGLGPLGGARGRGGQQRRFVVSPGGQDDDETEEAARRRNLLQKLERSLKGREPPTVYVQTDAEGNKTRIPLPAGPNVLLLFFSVVMACALGLLGVFVGNFVGVPPLATLSLKPAGLATGAILALPLFAVDALLQGFQEDTASEVYSLSIFGTRTPLATVLALAAAVTLATGIGEEVLFRGLIQQGLSGILGSWGGLGAGAVIFGLAHQLGPSDLSFIAGAGAWMGFTYLLTGDLTVPIGVHFVFDFLVLASAYLRAKIRIGPLPPRDGEGE